jgi:hypothetical protein
MDVGAYASVAAALVTGSAATLVPKVLLSLPCATACGGAGSFSAPLFSGLIVFSASALGLLEVAWRRRAAGMPLQPWVTRYPVLLLPGTLAALGTLLQLSALLYLSAAVLAGLRGVFILLTAIASARLGLKDRPSGGAEWGCVGAAAVGAVLVGAAAALQEADAPGTEGGESGAMGLAPASAAALGLLLSVCGYSLAAGQVAVEALALDGETMAQAGRGPAFSRWEVLGVEGAWGALLAVAALGGLEAAGGGGPPPSTGPLSGDLPSRTLCCLSSSPGTLGGLSLAYAATSLSFNAQLLALSSAVGPNYRVFVFTARGALTWAAELAIFYAGSASVAAYGEGLSPASALQAVGFILLIGSGIHRSTLVAARGSGGGSGGAGRKADLEEDMEAKLLEEVKGGSS